MTENSDRIKKEIESKTQQELLLLYEQAERWRMGHIDSPEFELQVFTYTLYGIKDNTFIDCAVNALAWYLGSLYVKSLGIQPKVTYYDPTDNW
jgi:hypothetical protein